MKHSGVSGLRQTSWQVCLFIVITILTTLLAGCAAPAAPAAPAPTQPAAQQPVAANPTVAQAQPTAAAAQPAASDLKKITMRIGRIPQAQGLSPVTEIMRKDKLIEKVGKDYGFDITVDWQDFPNGAVIRQGMTGDQLDFGTVGSTPVAIGLAQGEPIHPLAVSEGRVKFLVTLPAGSEIHKLDDLKGKKVGLIMGTENQFYFDQMLDLAYGTTDYAKLGIEVVAIKTLNQGAVPPEGLVASAGTIAPWLGGQVQKLNTALVNSYGYTEANYDGPLGKGAGIELPERKKSPYYPEGIWLGRNWWCVTDKFVKANPKAVTAFLVALQQGLNTAKKMAPEDVAALSKGYWNLEPAVGKEIWTNDTDYIRGWGWATEGDVLAIKDISDLVAKGGTIPKGLTWQQVMDSIKPVAPLAKEAWEKAQFPAVAEFTAQNTPDLRGLPIWDMDKWERPKK